MRLKGQGQGLLGHMTVRGTRGTRDDQGHWGHWCYNKTATVKKMRTQHVHLILGLDACVRCPGARDTKAIIVGRLRDDGFFQ